MMKLFPGILVTLFFTVSAMAQSGPACVMPDRITSPAMRSVDYRNANVETDYYAYVLSWSPEHCERQRIAGNAARHAFQCESNAFGFVVHGLWPQSRAAANARQHPRHCKTSEALSVDLIKKHICTVPGADLMQNEWQAHGTCAFDSAADYFQRIEALYARWPRTRVDQWAAPGRSVSVGQLKNAVAAESSGNLAADQIAVFVSSGNYLKEIWICLDLSFEPISCAGAGTPNSQAIRIRPVRTTQSDGQTVVTTLDRRIKEPETSVDADCPRPQRKFVGYSSAVKSAFWNSLYASGGNTIYCNVPFRSDQRRTPKGLLVNIEHAVPQSRIRAASGKGDLHNLWPSIMEINSARGNHVFVDSIPGETPAFAASPKAELAICDFEVQTIRKRDGGQTTVVEPTQMARGPLARAGLHMALAYPDTRISAEEWQLFLSWHKSFPVSDAEKTRNHLIERIQGTRNPFIDQPDLADALVSSCRN
ncbi:MAG: endonuclease [Burkholderiales bacterium]|nr:endonuclease [Burkholderiales bacterium]